MQVVDACIGTQAVEGHLEVSASARSHCPQGQADRIFGQNLRLAVPHSGNEKAVSKFDGAYVDQDDVTRRVDPVVQVRRHLSDQLPLQGS